MMQESFGVKVRTVTMVMLNLNFDLSFPRQSLQCRTLNQDRLPKRPTRLPARKSKLYICTPAWLAQRAKNGMMWHCCFLPLSNLAVKCCYCSLFTVRCNSGFMLDVDIQVCVSWNWSVVIQMLYLGVRCWYSGACEPTVKCCHSGVTFGSEVLIIRCMWVDSEVLSFRCYVMTERWCY